MRENAWWTEVSGPSRFIAAAAESAAAQKSCILALPNNIPFEDEFFEILRERVENELGGQETSILGDIAGQVSDYFLNTYCRRELRASYRPKPGYSVARFLAEAPSSVMHGRGFIVRIENSMELAGWTSFASDYTSGISKSITPAVFILVVQADAKPKAVKGLRAIDLRDYSSPFDTYAYCAIQAAAISEPNIIKTYLAELASGITSGNAEQAEKAIYIYREFLQDPVLFAKKHYGKSGEDEEDLRRIVWEAQLKCIFPYLEKYRCSFVEKYEKEISRQLPLSNPLGDDYVNASDVELGALLFMTYSGMFRVPHDEYEELKLKATARNLLAHLTVLDYSMIKEIAAG